MAKKAKREIIHYVSDIETQTYCEIQIKERKTFQPPTIFASANPEHTTCKKCQKKLKEEKALKEKLDTYRKELEKEMGDPDDNWVQGYHMAILNLLGEHPNGHCDDCPFAYGIEVPAPDFITPEYGISCSLGRCWITSVKEIIKKGGKSNRKGCPIATETDCIDCNNILCYDEKEPNKGSETNGKATKKDR